MKMACDRVIILQRERSLVVQGRRLKLSPSSRSFYGGVRGTYSPNFAVNWSLLARKDYGEGVDEFDLDACNAPIIRD